MNDFNLLCSIGVFNASLMNDAIFKFKRYEDSSLSYTGIEKHLSEDVGGWDTVIRREEYEKLFYNQQATMERLTDEIAAADDDEAENGGTMSENHGVDFSFEPPMSEDEFHDTMSEGVKFQASMSEGPTKERPTPREEFDCALVEIGTSVTHAKFGDGKVVKIDKSHTYITVAFSVGEKTFVMPSCFDLGFLRLL